MIDWLSKNKTWVFSGIGVVVLSGALNIVLLLFKFPHSAKPDPPGETAAVAVGPSKGSTSGENAGEGDKVPLEAYTGLFEGYMKYFSNSLRPNSVEHVISDSVVKEIVGSAISVNNLGEIRLSVAPWGYASLFRDQLNFFEFRDAVPLPASAGKNTWNTYHATENPLEQMYYQINGEIGNNLRSYFSDPIRLDSFYRAKKSSIKEGVRESISFALKPRFLSEMDQVIQSFQLVLSTEYRTTFEDYLEAERRYTLARYGRASEEEIAIRFQGLYNRHNGPVRALYPTFAEGDPIQEKPVDYALEEELAAARTVLFNRTPNVKAAAFAYRRHLEGGEKLVERYIAILKDLRNSVFD